MPTRVGIDRETEINFHPISKGYDNEMFAFSDEHFLTRTTTAVPKVVSTAET
jgi:hypothetical protein